MKHDVWVKNGVIIPEHELEITTSKAGGPGGQHVNKTDTKITIRWNVNNSQVFSEEKKAYMLKNLSTQLTQEGDLVVSEHASRSQLQNKKNALLKLAQIVRKALHVPKKRIPTATPRSIIETRLYNKSQRSKLKKTRRVRYDEN